MMLPPCACGATCNLTSRQACPMMPILGRVKKSCQQAMFHMGIDQQVTWDLTEPNWKATNQGSKLPCGTSRVKKTGLNHQSWH
jgi:hypothetical protein